MPIQRSRQHGARKAAKIISRNFRRLNRRTDKLEAAAGDIAECCVDLCDAAIYLAEKDDEKQERIGRLERNLDHATDTLSEEVDRLGSRIMGLGVALVVFGVLLLAALVVVWSKLNG